MPKVTIYHNPRCSKSRQTLLLLQQHNIQPTIIEYLTAPPSIEELKHILALLKQSPRDLMRQKETIYQEKNLDNKALSDTELMKAMLDNPILIERPIVVASNKAVIGRPPENILELL